ncbi:MAG: class I adenylate-forming enzyme family protein [Solirubrobacterales bacterium]
MIEFDPVLVHDWLGRSARRAPEKDAILCDGERWSYRKLDVSSNRFAEGLIELGMRKQDRVVILTGNCIDTVVSLYGTLKAGGVFVILDANTKARRLSHILTNSGARIVVAQANQASIVREAVAESGVDPKVIWAGSHTGASECRDIPGAAGDTLLSAIAGGNGDGSGPTVDRFPRCIDIDLAMLVYTSGTTGDPKGVMCCHRDVVSAAKSIMQYLDNRPEDVILNTLSLSHSYGLYQVFMASMFGGTVVLESSFLYPHLVLKHIAQEGVTGFPLVPNMAAMMLRMGNLGAYDFKTLRYVTSASAALPVSHLAGLRRLMPQAKFYNMYGLTECVRVCYLGGDELDRRPDSVGRTMPNCEVRVVDESGNEVGPGKAGELIIRGSNVMQGYWQDRETTARVYRPDPRSASRWLHSGDCFRTDEEGRLYFLGRKDDMIKTRGERVSPKEVEDALCELEDVAEAAVIGVPDEILGQAIKAFVVTRTGGLVEKAVLRHCADRLFPFMVPKYVEFIAALPKNANGKIDRRILQTAEAKE